MPLLLWVIFARWCGGKKSPCFMIVIKQGDFVVDYSSSWEVQWGQRVASMAISDLQ